nr:IS1 family transposase [Escherichia coli]
MNKTITALAIMMASFAANASVFGFAPIFPDICYHLTHYKPAAADIPVESVELHDKVIGHYLNIKHYQ